MEEQKNCQERLKIKIFFISVHGRDLNINVFAPLFYCDIFTSHALRISVRAFSQDKRRRR